MTTMNGTIDGWACRRRRSVVGSGSRARRRSSPASRCSAGSAGRGCWSIPLLLLPDLSAVGYLRGPRLGAFTYNLVHNWALGLGGARRSACVADIAPVAIAGAILVAHVGMDRAVGYGLKLSTSFQDTHLGRIGREVGTDRYACGSPAGAAQGGAEHVSERTPRCVSERARRQRGDVPDREPP